MRTHHTVLPSGSFTGRTLLPRTLRDSAGEFSGTEVACARATTRLIDRAVRKRKRRATRANSDGMFALRPRLQTWARIAPGQMRYLSLLFQYSQKKIGVHGKFQSIQTKKWAALAQYLESERPNHRLMTASGYSSTSSLLSLPAPTFAPTPTAARIRASISCAISGFSFRNLRVLSLP